MIDTELETSLKNYEVIRDDNKAEKINKVRSIYGVKQNSCPTNKYWIFVDFKDKTFYEISNKDPRKDKEECRRILANLKESIRYTNRNKSLFGS